MSKTITIIQLLNKIANGEEVPKRIKYQCVIGEWNNGMLDYMYNDVEGIFDDFICNLCNDLNDEVEIIEDNTEEIKELPDYNYSIKENRDKINELVKAVNQLAKKINK